MAAPAARAVVHRRFETVVDAPSLPAGVATESSPTDVVVHSVPDILGRVLPAPRGSQTLTVVDRATGVSVEDGIPYGRSAQLPPADIAARLAEVWKLLLQRRGVRSVLARPAAFGLAFVAPEGLSVPSDLQATSVVFPGLPDLIVVHDPYASAWTAYDDGDDEYCSS